MRFPTDRRSLFQAAVVAYVLVACAQLSGPRAQRNGWWSGNGPVVPHENFPADCSLCHVGNTWNVLAPDFQFDHAAETGVPLDGAHEAARCLRCHNDRGPVELFANQGCNGCHEDIHFGQLGTTCTECHTERSWEPFGQVERHNRTRFPLVGVHAATACRACHPGAEVGQYLPIDTQCLTCHTQDLARALNPNHQALGLLNRCDRCHQPTDWNKAELN